MWTIWDCLTVACRKGLVDLQRRLYHRELRAPAPDAQVEPAEQLARIARERPHRPQGHRP